MNPMFPVKEEYLGGPSSSSSWQPIEKQHEVAPLPPPPRPMEGLHETGPPPFLTKTFEMVDNLAIDHIVSWSRGGCSFVVWDPHAFSTSVLPRYFKHNNFSSFIRQLNTYGFRKIDPDKWEFANGGFIRGQKHLLKNIRRRKAPSQPLPLEQAIGPCVEVGRFGLDAEINQLRRDKKVLIMEIVKLRQQQQSTRSYLNQMELKLQGAEKKQKKMMNFLARAMQNPEFIQKLLLQKEKRKELEEANSKRRPLDDPGPSEETSRTNEGLNLFNTEPLKFDITYRSQVSELEALALEMQGFGKVGREREEYQDKFEQIGSSDKELDAGFWEELLN
ncbi:heat stress transcription factor A-7a-like [Olea europaea subsp. europaea]|uniref:Heat stress transcription factor n=1 Tax=Olea europaea subsp. europaea TaxID=158383 RepID=A0A8S0RR96_OLEEU|nr:heat stress transcription factor A-7a-like [Olea europaea subsp. europaea]